MFPTNTKNLWINYLSGTFGDKHVVDMIIGTDGKSCKGLYTFRSSKATLFFDGNDSKEEILLAEMDAKSKFTGYLFGKYDGNALVGSWLNKDKTTQVPVKLSFVNNFTDYNPDLRVEDQWVRTYQGVVKEKNIKIQLKRCGKKYECTLYDENNSKQKDTASISGKRVDFLKLQLSNSVMSDKYILVDTSNLGKIDVVLPDETGYEETYTLIISSQLEYAMYEYADYHSTLECIRPIVSNKKFDMWMTTVFKKWLSDHVTKLKSVHQEEIGTKERWVQSANGWVEVHYFDNDLISGHIYMQNSWQTATVKIPFIYDLKVGKELKLQDVFDDKFDCKAYFSLLIPDKVKSTKWQKNVNSWVIKQPFEHVCLTENGFSWSTSYHTVYGEKEVLMPYSEVKQFIKPRFTLY